MAGPVDALAFSGDRSMLVELHSAFNSPLKLLTLKEVVKHVHDLLQVGEGVPCRRHFPWPRKGVDARMTPRCHRNFSIINAMANGLIADVIGLLLGWDGKRCQCDGGRYQYDGC